jgi:hypothetical protein
MNYVQACRRLLERDEENSLGGKRARPRGVA